MFILNMKIFWILIISNIIFIFLVVLYKYDLEELDNVEVLRKIIVFVFVVRIIKVYCLYDKVILLKLGVKMLII